MGSMEEAKNAWNEVWDTALVCGCKTLIRQTWILLMMMMMLLLLLLLLLEGVQASSGFCNDSRPQQEMTRVRLSMDGHSL